MIESFFLYKEFLTFRVHMYEYVYIYSCTKSYSCTCTLSPLSDVTGRRAAREIQVSARGAKRGAARARACMCRVSTHRAESAISELVARLAAAWRASRLRARVSRLALRSASRAARLRTSTILDSHLSKS